MDVLGNGQSQPGTNGNEQADTSLVPVARIPAELAIPVMRPAADSVKPPSGERKAIFAAFRRRWLVAVSLGLLLGGMTASVVWYLVPAPYTAYAELHMHSAPPRVLFKTAEVHTDFATYKQTQIRLMQSPFLLAAALRKPSVSKLPMLRDIPYPVEWLQNNLVTSSPGTEFVRISLSGDKPRELAAIVNAVYDSYLDDVVQSDHEKRFVRKKELDDILLGIQDKVKLKKTAVRKLAEVLNTGDTQVLSLKQQLVVERLGQIRQQHTEIQFDLTRAQTQLAVKQKVAPGTDDLQVPEVIVELALARNATIQRLESRVQYLEDLVSRTRLAVSSNDSPVLKKRVAELRSVTNCGFWEGEAPAEPHSSTGFRLPKRRVSVFGRAEYTLH